MKKTLLLLALLISLINNAQTTPIPDANFENKLIALGIDTNGFTGDILNVDAEAQININVSNSNINDLTGIEAFINLGVLNCNNNNLNAINVSTLLSLGVLSCSQNNINALDVSNNSILSALFFENNNVNTLNLVNNNNLTHLSCFNNQIGSLSVVNLTLLQYLSCSDNPINNLDLTQNTFLNHLNVTNCQLNTLDISNNILLENIYVNINQLQSIDVSVHPNLVNLSCGTNQLNTLDVSNNPLLERLNCGVNFFQELDLSSNPNLIAFRAFNNQLTSLNLANGNNNLIPTGNFAIGLNNLTCVQVSDVAYATANWTNKDAATSYHLNCATTQIPDANFENKLIALGVDTNGFTGDILNEDAESFPINLLLNLSNSNITDLTGIEAFTNLQNLNIDDNNIQFLDFSGNLDLRNLRLNNNQVHTLDVSMLPNLLSIQCNLNTFINLDFSNNVLLIDISCRNNNITSLDLSNNTQLKKLNASFNDLTTLNLDNGNNVNIITNDLFITQNNNLTCVKVSDVAYANTNWTNKDANTSYHLSCATIAIPDAFFEAKLILLGIDTNGPVVNGTILVEDALAVNNLDISSSFITNLTGIESFTNLNTLNFDDNLVQNVDLSSNVNLISLTASNNQLQQLDLTQNQEITFLDCWNNQLQSLDTSVLPNLEQLFCNNNQIASLDMTQNTALFLFIANDNLLNDLNLANGINGDIAAGDFAINNNNLTCVLVSDVAYCNANWLAKDANTSYHLSCATTAIPNGDFEFKLIALGIDTNGMTGDIINEDAEAVTDLDISNFGIETIIGIEAFINLETLNASNNSLGINHDENFSQNTKLRELELRSNILVNIDVSNLPLLEFLEVSFNNIGSLDVSNNPNLRLLYCANNQMGTVTLGNKPNLKELLGKENNFNQIDFSQAPQMRILGINDNQLTSLDMSNNPNLEILQCGNNLLTNLDVRNGNNSIISNIWFSATNNNLTCVNVSDVAYANANWSNGIDIGVSFSLDCFPTTPVPDAAFESKLIILGIDTNGFTGDILNADAELVNNLDVSNSFINDLAGIEAFINLTSLDCSNNNISTLNTSSSSILTDLNCSNNTLTSLNVFGNNNLQILDCSFNNLATLNLVFNNNLVELYCTSNTISSLNIANKNLLEKLECGANNLNSLDVLANLNLTRLSTYSNNIAAIDVSNNSALTYLSVANNQLNSLDVSANINLTTLSCFNNNLTELDLTSNTQLSRLNCNDNQLSTLNMRNGNNNNIPTANFDATNNNLTCIKANDIPFATANWTNIDAEVTFELYCEPFTLIPDADFETKLINLGIDTNGFTGDILNSDATPIINLDISNFGIEDITGIEAFINLENLDAQQNLLTDVDFSQNVSLRILNLKNNNINTIDVTQNIDLTYLNLNSNQLLTIDVANNVNLETLGVFDNMLNSLNVTTNTALTNLNASSNNLGNIDLSNATLLEVLRLKNNTFVNLDLSNNIALSFLDLKVNQIANLDLTQNVNLITAKISNNTFNTIDLTLLVLLENLELRRTDISTIDLSQNTALKTLKIGQNFIRDLDVNANINLIDLTVNGGTTATSQARKIKTINFTQCVNLVNLDVNNNLLESIKLPNTNTLVNINVNTNNLDCLDLSNKTGLKEFLAIDNDFHYINAKNANLVNWITFETTGNPNLTCINVDDAVFATANFGGTIDNTSSFSVDCYPSTIWNGANWNNGLPNATKTAVIKADYDTLNNGSFTAFELVVDANQTLTITKDLFINISHSITNLGLITVEHSGSFVQTLNCGLFKGNGDFYVGKKTNPLIDDDRFTYWSSPLEGQLLGNVLEYANQNQFYNFDATIQDWNNVSNTTEMLPSIGYVAKPLSNATFPLEAIVTFKGTAPHNGIYKTPVVFNAGGIDDDNNLIGNPYPSAINANFLFFENPNLSTLYFWTPNSAIVNGAYAGDDYATYSLAGGTAAVTGGPIKSKYIASCQGFFASTNASGNVTFKNNMRSSSFNDDFRNNEEGNDDKIWIDMYNDDGLFNQALIAFLPNGTNDIDQGYDGLKYNSGNAISFYSLGGNQEQLVIQAKGLLRETETIPLGYHIGNETISTLKINIAQFENLENVAVYLKDNVLNITHDLKRGAYEFSVSETGNFNNRFELIFNRNALATTNEVINNNLIVFNESETEIVVKMNNASVIKSFVAYDILGKEVMRLKPNKSTFRIKTSLKQGTVLFIKATLENDQVLLKKFLKN